MNHTVCLLNDSFPPLIDGVANTVMNYARLLPEFEHDTLVVTPSYPEYDDSSYSYPVVRYPSILTDKVIGYPTGIPFSPEIARCVQQSQVELFHSHCPVMSTFMARQLREIVDVPIVFTYHTKFDIDIDNITKSKPLRVACRKVLVNNISACDEVWAVSKGAGENLRSIGYQGDYIVMHNGVDMPRGKASPEEIQSATAEYNLPEGVPVFLFVGRMMWYKGHKITIDALSQLTRKGMDYRMVFIGSGDNLPEIKEYVQECQISDRCIFTGPIHDRSVLKAWYSRCDLFLFPSTYDTNGLVVREASACGVASVLVAGSCAAEGVTDGVNGFLIEENPESMAACLEKLTIPQMRTVGEHACNDLYISWESAIKTAADRYEVVKERYKLEGRHHRLKPTDMIMKANGEMMEVLAKLSIHRSRKWLRSQLELLKRTGFGDSD